MEDVIFIKVAGFRLDITKSDNPPWVLFTFFKLYKNGIKSHKPSHIC